MFEKRIYTMLTGMDLEQKVKAKRLEIESMEKVAKERLNF